MFLRIGIPMPASAAPLLPMADDHMAAARSTLENVFGYKGFSVAAERYHRNYVERRRLLSANADRRRQVALLPDPISRACRHRHRSSHSLIALMQDQVDALRDVGVKAAFLNSTQDRATQDQIERQFAAGALGPSLRGTGAARTGAHAGAARTQRHRAFLRSMRRTAFRSGGTISGPNTANSKFSRRGFQAFRVSR